MKSFPQTAVIVLAAGKGTRMKSDLPKVLHKIADKPIVCHTLDKLCQLNLGKIIVVVGYQKDQVKNALKHPVDCVFQEEQLGTGHAVLQTLPYIPKKFNTILILNGDDSAFYKISTLAKILEQHIRSKVKMTVLTITQKEAEVAGRVVRNEQGYFIGIKPKSQMTEDDYKNNHELICGLYVFDHQWLNDELPKVEQDKKGEYNITGLIDTALKQSSLQDITLSNNNEWRSINTQAELEKARKLWKQLH